MRDIKIDPVTQDLVRDGRGGFVYATGAETSVLHQLSIHFGGDWLSPEDGSRLHELSLFSTAAPAADIEAETRRSLDVLVRRGRIADPSVEARQIKPGRVDVNVSYRDVRSGQLIRFTTSVPE